MRGRCEVLSSEHRMRRSADFRATVRRGVRVARPLLVVHLASSGTDATIGPQPVRAGFVVGRSLGGAVARNVVRRRLRHLLRDRLDRLPVGACVVVRARPEAAHAPSAVLARELDSALDRALMRV